MSVADENDQSRTIRSYNTSDRNLEKIVLVYFLFAYNHSLLNKV